MSRISMTWAALAVACLLGAAAPASAAESALEDAPSVVHPIYAHMPDATQNDTALRELTAAAGHYRLRMVEVVDIEAPPPPKTAAELKAGIQLVQKLAFADALKQLDAAATDADNSGGAGLSVAEMADVYFYRAMAIAKADWKPERSVDAATRARAFEDYVRAAAINPDRTMEPRDLPPQVLEDWQAAVAEMRRRPKGTLIVRGPAQADITVDGKRPASTESTGATFPDLSYGEHLVQVNQVGHAPWGSRALVNLPSADLIVPPLPALTFDDGTAAAHARRMGAKFALLAELKLGDGPPQIEMRLIDITGIRHDAGRAPLTGEVGAIDATVMRLDEEARRIDQLGLAPSNSAVATPLPTAPPPPTTPVAVVGPTPRATLRDDPAAWARDHWPLVTAVGVMAAATLVLGLTVAFEGSHH
jgi:hypothetical protein